jgi:lipid A disaccharide synthetase
MLNHYIKAGKPMIALPNIILKRMVIPEVFPVGENAKFLIDAAKDYLDDDAKRLNQIATYKEMKNLLEKGEKEAPRADPTDLVLTYLS